MGWSGSLKTVESLIQELESLTHKLSTYKNISPVQWNNPISKDKWSPSQIISHISAWDEILIIDILPALIREQAIQFPNTQMINSEAAQFATTISQYELLGQATKKRQQLVQTFRELPDKLKDITFTMNGYEQDPKTGELFTLSYLLTDFIEHDLHHTRQINTFLENNK